MLFNKVKQHLKGTYFNNAPILNNALVLIMQTLMQTTRVNELKIKISKWIILSLNSEKWDRDLDLDRGCESLVASFFSEKVPFFALSDAQKVSSYPDEMYLNEMVKNKHYCKFNNFISQFQLIYSHYV